MSKINKEPKYINKVVLKFSNNAKNQGIIIHLSSYLDFRILNTNKSIQCPAVRAHR